MKLKKVLAILMTTATVMSMTVGNVSFAAGTDMPTAVQQGGEKCAMNVIKTYNSQYTHLSTGLTCRVRREKECVLCVDIKSQKTLRRQENIASAINLFRGQREKKIKN